MENNPNDYLDQNTRTISSKIGGDKIFIVKTIIYSTDEAVFDFLI
jgi:hypothetical protein